MSVPKEHSLIDINDSILLVIDVQDAFLSKLPEHGRASLVTRIGWLALVAGKLSIPVVVTAEDIPVLGGVNSRIINLLPPNTKTFDKKSFGLATDTEIMSELKKSSRRTVILTGLETDVCIAQSAIGLMEAGYRVAVPCDAVGSPGTGHEFGLERMRNAGVVMTSVKGLYFEWLRTPEHANEFRARYSKEFFPEIEL